MSRLVLSLLLLALVSHAGASEAQTPEQRLPVCAACHGATGISKTEGIPSLGGMPRNYVLVQLILFRENRRVAAPMNAMVAGMSDDDLQTMADLVAALPAPAPEALARPSTGTDATLEEGRVLAMKYHCLSCHGSDLAGHGQIPRIAGQREDYLLKSLTDYKNNTRAAYQPAMIEAIQDVPDSEIAILAKFVSQFQ